MELFHPTCISVDPGKLTYTLKKLPFQKVPDDRLPNNFRFGVFAEKTTPARIFHPKWGADGEKKLAGP